jgi:seryl-tRNA synthetase
MITARYARENIDAIRASLQKRRMEYDVDRLLKLDEEWRGLKTETQKLQEERNRTSLEISELKKRKSGQADALIGAMAEIKKGIEANEKKMSEYEADISKLLMGLPNTLHESVPYGESGDDNVLVRTHGKPSARPNAKGHEEIATRLGMLDIERAAKVAGARFYYLKGDLALLDLSLTRFAIDMLSNKGFVPVIPPFMMREEAYRGVTSLDDFEKVIYKSVSDEGTMKMISTSEHPMAAMYMNEVLDKKDLPIKLAGISPCFRVEAGTHGKDTKGIFRVHQFNKVEQFVFSRQEDSWRIFDELIGNSEEIFKALGIPYRIVNICTGDIGIVAAKKYDLEGYMPVQGKYRELVSCSNCTDWQSMRLDIKYDEGGKRKYVHTLNSTAIAVERTIVAIIENYANDDGTITVPDALAGYMGKRRIG